MYEGFQRVSQGQGGKVGPMLQGAQGVRHGFRHHTDDDTTRTNTLLMRPLLPHAGVCDPLDGFCYCPPETKYGRVLAPEGSPPGTPPVKWGRALHMCNPRYVSAVAS